MRGPGCAQREKRGFTLLELLIVVVILGILAAVIAPRFTASASDTKKSGCRHNKAVINEAVERYYALEGKWPAKNLADIGADTRYFPDGLPTCPEDGGAYQLDLDTHRVQGHGN
jgi:general secretion pathway protein G